MATVDFDEARASVDQVLSGISIGMIEAIVEQLGLTSAAAESRRRLRT
jgi:hypothetical protein